jgi:phytoene synthase
MHSLKQPKSIAASRRYCRRLSKASGSNFLWAFPSLGKSKRRAMYALYAFMRYSDDLVDAVSTSEKPLSPLDASPKDRLKHWRDLLKFCLQDDIPPNFDKQASSASKASKNNVPSDSILIVPALLETIEHYQIPRDLFFAVLDGVEMDLTKNRYENFSQLQLYCERVASTVGLACIHIWGFAGQGRPEAAEVFELARKVGIAYQLTNILRDIKEDAERDRVYLPQDEISSAGYSVDEINRGVVNPAFDRLLHSQTQRAEECYAASRELYARLMPDGKKIFGLMTATYHAILKKIAADPAAVFRKRIRLGKFERIRLLARWTFLTPKELVL